METISFGMQHGAHRQRRTRVSGWLGLEDVELPVGNSGDLGSFSTLTGDDLPSLTIGDDDGADGSDRLNMIWH